MQQVNVLWWLIVGLVVAGLCYGAIVVYERQAAPPPNLLLISIDTLRADRLGCYGYPRPTSPNIDQLASEGILLHNFYSPRALTAPALATMLSGLEPFNHRVRYNYHDPKHLRSMAHVLSDEGYLCRAYLANTGWFIKRGFDSGSQEFSDIIDHTIRDNTITSLGIQFLSQRNPDSDQPFFLWLHYMSPHRPYMPPDPWERGLNNTNQRESIYYEERLDNYMAEKIDLSDGRLAEINNYYDGCVAFADSLVAKVLKTLREQGLEDNTLVVLTADHGEELYEQNHYFLHQVSMYHHCLRVPLILKWPGHLPPGLKVSQQVGMVNLVSTLLSILGVKNPLPSDGVDFTELLETYYPGGLNAEAFEIRQKWDKRPIYIEMVRPEGFVFGVYKRPYQYIWQEEPRVFASFPGESPVKRSADIFFPAEQLYDFVLDATCGNNLVDSRPVVRAELRSIVKQILAENPETLELDRSLLSSEDLDRLEDMGYLVP